MLIDLKIFSTALHEHNKETKKIKKENFCEMDPGACGKEKTYEHAKKGTTDGTPTQYKLQLKDLYRQIDNDLIENWNGTVKRRWY
jgi:hypothetical protein